MNTHGRWPAFQSRCVIWSYHELGNAFPNPFQNKKYAEQTDALNSHAFGTFGTSPAEQALAPKASGSK